MEAITGHDVLVTMPALEALPAERAEWPDDATREYHRLLRELNSWSRERDWPISGNSWIAEEAVRRTW